MAKHKTFKTQDDRPAEETTGENRQYRQPALSPQKTTEVMLRPNWPGSFRRTVGTGDQSKVLEFAPGEPVEVSQDDFKALSKDIGIALFEIERDEKGRPRFVESNVAAGVADPTQTPNPQKQEAESRDDNAENV